MKKFYKTIIKPALALIPSKARKKGIGIIMLMVLNAILDFFSLASFLPLVFLLINSGDGIENEFIRKIYESIGFTSKGSFIISLTLTILLFIVLKNIISIRIARVKGEYAFGIGNDLATRTLSHFMKMDYINYSQLDFTRELNRIANYPITFANNIIMPLANLITEVLVCVLIIGGIVLYDPKVLIMLCIVLLPPFLLYRIRKKSLKEISKDLKEKYPVLLKYANQSVEGFLEIKVYRKESFFLNKFRSMSESMSRVFVKDQTILSGTTRLMEVIMGIVICSLIIYSTVTQQNYQDALFLLSVYAGAGFRIIPSINRILHALQQIATHEYLLEGLLNADDQKDNQELVVDEIEFKKTIELKNISFAYSNRPPLLQNIALKIDKGTMISLTGNSGEGKTTMLLILMGFIKELRGDFLIDDKLITNLSDLRKLTGYVPQNPYIIDGTIAENIAFGINEELIDKTKIQSLIDELELNDLISQLPQGIDTNIGENGIKISGGQRQRLSIARALYADAQVLLLDEITNQLHPEIEMEIMKSLKSLSRKNKTIVVITHKPYDNNFFDVLYRLENGTLSRVM